MPNYTLQKKDAISTDSSWFIFRYPNGFCELYCNIDIPKSQLQISTNSNGIVKINAYVNLKFPVNFVPNPNVIVNSCNSVDYDYCSHYATIRTATEIVSITFVKFDPFTTTYLPVSIRVIGKLA